jgi:hypothetical protein
MARINVLGCRAGFGASKFNAIRVENVWFLALFATNSPYNHLPTAIVPAILRAFRHREALRLQIIYKNDEF